MDMINWQNVVDNWQAGPIYKFPDGKGIILDLTTGQETRARANTEEADDRITCTDDGQPLVDGKPIDWTTNPFVSGGGLTYTPVHEGQEEDIINAARFEEFAAEESPNLDAPFFIGAWEPEDAYGTWFIVYGCNLESVTAH